MDTAQPTASLEGALRHAQRIILGLRDLAQDRITDGNARELIRTEKLIDSALASAAPLEESARERELRETLGIALLAMRFATSIRAVNEAYDFSPAIEAAEKALYGKMFAAPSQGAQAPALNTPHD